MIDKTAEVSQMNAQELKCTAMTGVVADKGLLAMEIWSGKEADVEAAQLALVHRANCNRAARRGAYSASSTESNRMGPVGGPH